MSISVTVRGQKELDAKFKKLDAVVQSKIMREAVESGAKIVRADAMSRITSRTGRLRRSIKVGKAKKTKQGMSINVEAGAWYAHLIEFGHDWVVKNTTGHISGKPFLTPALDSRKDEVLSAISFKVKQGIMKVAG